MLDKETLRLVKRARRGNGDAFCRLAELKMRDILFVATKLMGNKNDGEDAAQEAIISIGRNIGHLKQPESFNSWIYRIVFNVCMAEKRRRENGSQEPASMEEAINTVPEHNTEVLPEQSMDHSLGKETLMRAIDELPDSYRACIVLFYYEGMSYGEIADSLDISESAVANILVRAKQKLKDSLHVQEEFLGMAGAARYGVAGVAPLTISGALSSNAEELVTATTAAKMNSSVSGMVSKGLVSKAGLYATIGKAVAAGVCAAAVCAGGIGIYSSVANGADSPTTAGPAQSPAPTAQVVQQPIDATMVAVVRNSGNADWKEYEKKADQLTFFGKSTTSGGLAYEIYAEDQGGQKKFYLVFDEGVTSITEPIYLDVGF